MTSKQRIQKMLQRLDDDTPIEVIIDKILLLKDIEAGLRDIEAGRVTDHDEFMAELMAEDEKIQARLDGQSKAKPARSKSANRAGSAKKPPWRT
jgi:hypothetical protein